MKRSCFLIAFLIAAILVGCMAQKQSVSPELRNAGVEGVKKRIRLLEDIYLGKKEGDVQKIYEEIYLITENSPEKKRIIKEVYKPLRKDVEFLTFFEKSFFFHKDMTNKFRFSRKNPGLVMARMVIPRKDIAKRSNKEILTLGIYKKLLNAPKAISVMYLPKEESINSLEKTLRESDRNKRNICFLITKMIPLNDTAGEKISKGSATEGIDYRDMCTVQCSEEINIYHEFDKPCWDPEVFRYLKRVYDTVRNQP